MLWARGSIAVRDLEFDFLFIYLFHFYLNHKPVKMKDRLAQLKEVTLLLRIMVAPVAEQEHGLTVAILSVEAPAAQAGCYVSNDT